MTNLSNEVYRSPKTLSNLAIAGLSLISLTQIISIIFGIGQVISPLSKFDEEDSLWIVFQGFVTLLHIPIYIFTIIFFLIWLNRTNKNLTPLKADYIQFSSGWAVGWWFIPFANLVKPFQVVREVWNESDPDFDPNLDFHLSSAGSPTILSFWWAFWIISNIASNISNRMVNDFINQFHRASSQDIILIGCLFIANGVLVLIAALLAIKVVYDITNRQEKRSLKVGSFQPTFQMPPAPPEFS